MLKRHQTGYKELINPIGLIAMETGLKMHAHLITNVETTASTIPDSERTLVIQKES